MYMLYLFIYKVLEEWAVLSTFSKLSVFTIHGNQLTLSAVNSNSLLYTFGMNVSPRNVAAMIRMPP